MKYKIKAQFIKLQRIMIIIAVISIVWYLADKDEHNCALQNQSTIENTHINLNQPSSQP